MSGNKVRLRQRGVSLIEALVALAVMGFGMLAIVGVQSTLRFNADIAMQRAQAARFAEQEIETLRSFGSLAAFDAIAAVPETALPDTGLNTTFRRTRDVVTTPDLQQRMLTVTVRWTDRRGDEQRVRINDLISRVDPVLSGFVKTERPLTPIGRRDGRHRTIPADAVNLPNDGSKSIFLPPNSSGAGWIFDNSTGAITHTCTNVSGYASVSSSTLSTDCTALNNPAQLVSGQIRFNLRGAAHNLGTVSVLKPAAAADAAWVIDHATSRLVRICPVPLATSAYDLTLGDVTTGCTTASVPISPFLPGDATHSMTAADSEDPRWPTLPATVELDTSWPYRGNLPISGGFQCYSNHQTSTLAHTVTSPARTWIDYFCIVTPTGPGGWGGRTRVKPLTLTDAYSGGTGATWSEGATAGQYKVCRYTQAMSDYTDNDDHPAVYAKNSSSCTSTSCTLVKGNLINQNFLVIDGAKSCPQESTPVDPASGNLINSNTIQHQPVP